MGRRAYGVDVNPVSCVIANSKLYSADGAEVAKDLEKVITTVQMNWASLDMARVPPKVQSRKWYGRRTLGELRKLWALVARGDSQFPDIARAAFSAILLGSCRETRHWGYVCDNTTPKTDREADARAKFIAVLRRFQAAYRSREQNGGRVRSSAQVLQGGRCRGVGNNWERVYFLCCHLSTISGGSRLREGSKVVDGSGLTGRSNPSGRRKSGLGVRGGEVGLLQSFLMNWRWFFPKYTEF